MTNGHRLRSRKISIARSWIKMIWRLLLCSVVMLFPQGISADEQLEQQSAEDYDLSPEQVINSFRLAVRGGVNACASLRIRS